MSFAGKTVFITGASRGIGLAVAKELGRLGANIAIAAKTAEPHPKLPGTIYTAAADIEAAGGKALPLICDIRFEQEVQAAIDKTVEKWVWRNLTDEIWRNRHSHQQRFSD